MKRLKYKEVKPTREALLKDQGFTCEICGAACSLEDAVLDHDHSSGFIRAVLHRSCNSFLGKIENNHKRFGVKDLKATLAGIALYLERHAGVDPSTAITHPTHKTPEEKKARARARRK